MRTGDVSRIAAIAVTDCVLNFQKIACREF